MGALQIRLNEIAECFTNEQSKLENLFEESKSMSRRLEEQTGSLEIEVAKGTADEIETLKCRLTNEKALRRARVDLFNTLLQSQRPTTIANNIRNGEWDRKIAELQGVRKNNWADCQI